MLLSHQNRKNNTFVLTLDETLAEDISERLGSDSPNPITRVVVPKPASGSLCVKDLDNLAQKTVTASLIIFDVRSLTLPLVQQVFNKIVGYNRQDLNIRCHSLLIGDGPQNLLEGGTLKAFAPLLAKCRIDYSAAAYFFDPFLHYASHEKPTGIGGEQRLLDHVPIRLMDGFQGDVKSVSQVRRFFRAASHPPVNRPPLCDKRLPALEQLFKARMKKVFPGQRDEARAMLSAEGLRLGDEPMPLHIYPMNFESRVNELLSRLG